MPVPRDGLGTPDRTHDRLEGRKRAVVVATLAEARTEPADEVADAAGRRS